MKMTNSGKGIVKDDIDSPSMRRRNILTPTVEESFKKSLSPLSKDGKPTGTDEPSATSTTNDVISSPATITTTTAIKKNTNSSKRIHQDSIVQQHSIQYWQRCIVLTGITIAILSIQVYVRSLDGRSQAPGTLFFSNMISSLLLGEGSTTRSTSTTTRNFNKVANAPLTAVKKNHDQCRIYLAPSSVKGLHGFGVFTTTDLYAGESILQAPDGPSIPVIDYMDSLPFEGNDNKDKNITAKHRANWHDVWNSYWWARGVSDPVLHESSNDVIDYQIMFGSLPNHHCALDAIEHKWPTTTDLPEHAFHRNNPGIGAFSTYRGRDFFTKRDLEAGDEIFLNYGYCREGSGPDWADYIPKSTDFETASRITKRLHRYIRQYTSSTKHLQQVDYDDDDSNAATASITEKTYTELLAKATHSVRRIVTDKVEMLLPSTYDVFQELMDDIPEEAWNPSNDDDTADIARALAKYIGTNVRDVQWIRTNGICVENIIPKPSTIPHAGRGAFAQFAISANDVIVPAPMLQILNRDVMALYDKSGKQYGSQLLENYCFGHVESTLLLCPNTNAILINHCSIRSSSTCGGSSAGPNAMYRWATTWDPATEEWMNMSIDEMLNHDGRGISMEIIATRDINPGEEIFMDYGELWEKSWEEHKEKWMKSKHGKKNKQKSVDVLNSIDGPLTELVSGSIRTVAKDDNIRTMCVYWTNEVDNESIYKETTKDWEKMDDTAILDTFASDGDIYDTDFATHRENTYWPCSVLLPEDELGEYYTVRIHQAPFAKTTPWGKSGTPRFITGYPRSSIRYFYYPYKSEMHVKGSFRRPIEIRNEIFPEKWKNRKFSATTL